MVPNDEPKSVNIDKISTALHVYYLNLIVNYLNTVQIAQIQAYNFECTPCLDATSGPMNRVFNIKSGHDFCRYRNSIQVIYFQINDCRSYVLRFLSILSYLLDNNVLLCLNITEMNFLFLFLISCTFQALTRISYFSRTFQGPLKWIFLFKHFSRVSSTFTEPCFQCILRFPLNKYFSY